ncbi:MAG: phosphoadenylyl-sulfate reductase [Deltaproteobacteria bacterium]|nr:phosphoadenylyl-sulfate reductase [Deltaproteobacteria bacterium]MBW2447167.1 phosphoadenylyl-sulfate reductase [Deltaproteobacteria bacterium]
MSAPQPADEKAIDSSILRDIEEDRFASWEPEKILTWALKNFHPRLALSCSFGAPEGLILLDMMHRIEPGSRVFVLDTGRIPQATYDLMDRVRDRYGKNLEVVFPRAESVEGMVLADGLNLFYESIEKRQLCCRVRKVEPLRRYLSGVDAWVSGLRRDQNVTRSDTAKVEIDLAHGGIVKINPLADWSSEDVWHYVRENNVPTNRLHEAGYPSVGCEPCSRAIEPGDDPRAGRWWWENAETKECGIHVGEESGGSGI